MTKTFINALALALFDAFDEDAPGAWGLGDCREFAKSFVEENAELFTQPTPAARAQAIVQRAGPQPADLREPGQPLGVENGGTGFRRVPVVGPDGLTDRQRAAVGGVGLCPNCQQPKNDHLPACAVASGENPRARTTNPLPPAV